MIGIALMAAAQLFGEVSTSIGKYEVSKKKETIYAVGFINLILTTVFFLLMAAFGKVDFSFSLASLPTFALRVVFEIIALFVGLRAVLLADRSTFAFLHTLTIPLLLAVDVMLIFLLLNHGLSPKGKIHCLLTSIVVTVTISLFKYNVTHFNSVAAEQSIMMIILIIVLLVAAKFYTKENLFKYLTKPIFLLQAALAGVSHVCLSFAFLFAPASILVTAKRCFEIVIAVAFGKAYPDASFEVVNDKTYLNFIL